MSSDKLLVIRLVNSTSPWMTGPQACGQHLGMGFSCPYCSSQILGFFLSLHLRALPWPALILLAVSPCSGQPASYTSHFFVCHLMVALSPACMAFGLLNFSPGDSGAWREGQGTEVEADRPVFRSCWNLEILAPRVAEGWTLLHVAGGWTLLPQVLL